MDAKKARRSLLVYLEDYRAKSYDELSSLIGKVEIDECLKSFQIEVQVFWDDRPGGDVRVVGGIDDGGIRALIPLTESFIMNPQGGFVDESAT